MATGESTFGGNWNDLIGEYASWVINVPAWNISSINVQDAINELDTNKATNSSVILKADKTYTDIVADFYKYSIVRTVTSGNLTVAIKNYLWDDPSPTVPVKIQIWWVLRIITSALSYTENAWVNRYNLGSSELATKEVDMFVYLIYNTSLSQVVLGYSRIPSWTTCWEFSTSPTNEKFLWSWTWSFTTDSVINIGRFNIILSTGVAYTWSIPTTSVIINSPIYFSSWNYVSPTIVYNGTAFSGTIISNFRYMLSWKMIFISYIQEWTVDGVSISTVTATLPFSEKETYFSQWLNWFLTIWSWPWYGISNSSTVQLRWWLARLNWNAINANTFVISWSYEI